jgi:hypothetical protein
MHKFVQAKSKICTYCKGGVIMTSKTKWFPVVTALGAALLLGLMSAVVLADPPVSTNLSNGAALDVQILNPANSSEFRVPSGTPDINVNVDGTASIGQGDPDATFVYVIDVSGSTSGGGGTGCSPILDCEQKFFVALNNAVIADGSTDEVGIAVYGTNSATADMSAAGGDQIITTPNAGPGDVNTVINSTTSGGTVGQFTHKSVGSGSTSFTDGLIAATSIVNASTNGTNIVVFASDGGSNTDGGGFNAALAAMAATGATVNTIAIGASNSCNAGSAGTLQQIANTTGGVCYHVPDPGNLPGIIQNLIGSWLDLLEIDVDGGGFATIPNAQISLPLSQPGAVSVTYGIVNPTTVSSLGPADHTISVRATGSDVLSDTQSVTDSHTIHLLQLTASPANEVNDLNFDDTHTVTGAIIGGTGPDRDIDFAVSGQNAATATPNNVSLNATPNGASVDFVYTVPQDCASLGTDTITVSTTIASQLDSINVSKEWVDPVPPEVSCDPTVNPHGNKQPQAPGKGGQGQNQDGFYQLNAEDPNLANCTVTLQVVDGDGFVFPGPFLPGDKIKYTQAGFAMQQQKKIGSGKGQAGAVLYHLIGHGDLSVTGTDPSGNTTTVTCLVPPPPK